MLRHINTTTSPKRQLASAEYSRIISAAVINRQFRQMLLQDPLKAISNGYSGEQFEINSDDRDRLASIKASSLAEFATQLTQI